MQLYTEQICETSILLSTYQQRHILKLNTQKAITFQVKASKNSLYIHSTI